MQRLPPATPLGLHVGRGCWDGAAICSPAVVVLFQQFGPDGSVKINR